MSFYNSKKLTKPYPKRFLKHLSQFIGQAELCRPNARLLVTVSGGVDSVASLLALFHLGYKNLEIIHFNHQKRAASEKEAQYVADLAKSLGFKAHIYNLDLPVANFEAQARKMRYQKLKEHAQDFDFIVTAHHINDSLEWHLMSEFKSSSIKSSIGIPVKRGKFIRPFHAFTKKQILKFAREIELKYFEDETNQDLIFERNFIRDKIKNIKKQFKNPEKHFVNRYNQVARLLNISVFKEETYQVVEAQNGIHLYSPSLDFSGAYQIIEQQIKKLSSKKRGELSLQIKKLIKNANTGKLGPLSFSGGVHAFSNFGHIYFTRAKTNKELKSFLWQKIKLSQFRQDALSLKSFPSWIELKNNYGLSTRKKIPDYDSPGRYLAPMKLLCKWENDPQLKDKELIVRFIL